MHGLAPGELLALALYSSAFAICLLSWAKGAAPERFGATATFVVWMFFLGMQSVFGPPTVGVVAVPLLIADFLLSFGFLVLALRYASLWLGVAMLAQGCCLGAHALFISRAGHHQRDYAAASNVASAVLLLSLLFGTISSWRKRLAAARTTSDAVADQPAG